ncbi:MAG: hypothetical protein IKZ19_01700 [Clostridia bacterium]|nr:hypothetical protein [Clostridia bacterium]
MECKNLVKRVFALALCLVMTLAVFAGLPLKASAEGGIDSPEKLLEFLGGYSAADIVGSPDGPVVQLQNDVNLVLDTIEITGGSITLDLNGYSIIAETTAIRIAEDAGFGLADTMGGGVVSGYSEVGGYAVENHGSFVLHAGTVVCDGSNSVGIYSDGELTVMSGDVHAIYAPHYICGGTAVINDGLFYSDSFSALGIAGGTVYVNGGDFRAAAFGLYMDNRYSGIPADLTVSNGIFSGDRSGAAILTLDGVTASAVINNGTFSGNYAGLYAEDLAKVIVVHGGSFTCNDGAGGIVSYMGEAIGNSVDVIGVHVEDMIPANSTYSTDSFDVHVETIDGVNRFFSHSGQELYVEFTGMILAPVIESINAMSIITYAVGSDDWMGECATYAKDAVYDNLKNQGYEVDYDALSIEVVSLDLPTEDNGGDDFDVGVFTFRAMLGSNGEILASDPLSFDVLLPEMDETAETSSTEATEETYTETEPPAFSFEPNWGFTVESEPEDNNVETDEPSETEPTELEKSQKIFERINSRWITALVIVLAVAVVGLCCAAFILVVAIAVALIVKRRRK